MQILHLHLNSHPQKIPVFIDCNLWDHIAAFLQEHFPTHSIFLIADSNVASIYGEGAVQALEHLPGYRDFLRM